MRRLLAQGEICETFSWMAAQDSSAGLVCTLAVQEAEAWLFAVLWKQRAKLFLPPPRLRDVLRVTCPLRDSRVNKSITRSLKNG